MSLSTAGLARASSRRPWLVVAIWLLIIVGAAGYSAAGGARFSTEVAFLSEPESIQGYELIDERMGGETPLTETVLVTSETLTVDDPAFAERVGAVVTSLRALPDLVDTRPTSLFTYYEVRAVAPADAERMVSADRHTTLIHVTLRKGPAASEPVIAALDAVPDDDIRVLTVGVVSSGITYNHIAEEDIIKGEMFGIPVALIILVAVFGALVAAGLPIMLALASVIVATGIASFISTFTELSFFVVNMITMIGLAVGIDYALFIVDRYREERGNGHDRLAAIEVAGATASKAVLFSGVTVVVALVGLFMIPTTIFRSLGLGAILVVVVAVAAMLTLIPALLALLGDRIDWPRRRDYAAAAAAGAASDADSRGFWANLTRLVMARPILWASVTLAALVLLALPYRDLATGNAGPESLPPSETRDAYDLLSRDFQVGALAPVEIVLDTTRTPEHEALVADLVATLDATPGYVVGGTTVEWSEAGDLAVVATELTVGPNEPAAQDAIRALRNDTLPQVFAGSDVAVYVTGTTAFNVDFFAVVDRFTPIVFAFVLGLSFIFLTIVFRSIIVPAKAIVLNLLSVGAAYGAMVLVFQKGYLIDLFGFQRTPVIEAWIPIFLFCVLFGLSMDYHVFLLSRIREHYDHSADNRASVASGLRATARLITGASLIMVAVFAGFASGQLVMLQQMGFGLAVAVLIDATVIRSILVPSSMALLGHVNWYFPRWLEWLPDLRIEGQPRPAAAPSAED
jgi:RND superfamily putative drug exporter